MSFDQVLKIIPVLDLMQGQVVRAQRGERSAYRPIISGLAAGSAPRVLAPALLAAAGADVLYVADLDAIQGGAVQFTALASDALACRARLGPAAARVRAVYGSETLASLDALVGLAADASAILSLDFRHDRAVDPAGCNTQPALWPRSVIVMTLDRVGGAAGPDLATFAALRAAAPQCAWIGAGGVRDANDLREAADAGASAWLIASALHDGAVGRLAQGA